MIGFLFNLSQVLSLTLLLTCIWTLTSLFLSEAEKESKCLRSSGSPNCGGDNWDPSLNQEHHHHSSFDDEHYSQDPDTIVVEAAEGKWRSSELLAHFGEMTRTFRIIVIICLCGIILASLVQFICSSVVLFTPNYVSCTSRDHRNVLMIPLNWWGYHVTTYHYVLHPQSIASRTRRICGILLAVFILYLTGFVWPLAYNREHSSDGGDSFHSMSTLNGSIKDFFSNFHWKHWLKDLNLYYLELSCNLLFLFLYMVISCCLLRYMGYNDYDI